MQTPHLLEITDDLILATFGCFTGDCPHTNQAECWEAVKLEYIRLYRFYEASARQVGVVVPGFKHRDCFDPLPLEEAKKQHVCRICRSKDDARGPDDPFVYHFGKEYAHQKCLERCAPQPATSDAGVPHQPHGSLLRPATSAPVGVDPKVPFGHCNAPLSCSCVKCWQNRIKYGHPND